MGAWIETLFGGDTSSTSQVAPLVGAWIETLRDELVNKIAGSHPSWVRGLKRFNRKFQSLVVGRTPRGCVD